MHTSAYRYRLWQKQTHTPKTAHKSSTHKLLSCLSFIGLDNFSHCASSLWQFFSSLLQTGSSKTELLMHSSRKLPCAAWSQIYPVHHWAAVVQQQHYKELTCFMTHTVLMRDTLSRIASEFLHEVVWFILIETCSLGNSCSDLQHMCSALCEI